MSPPGGVFVAMAPPDLRLDRDQLIARHRFVAAGTLISAAMAYAFARKFEIWRGTASLPSASITSSSTRAFSWWSCLGHHQYERDTFMCRVSASIPAS